MSKTLAYCKGKPAADIIIYRKIPQISPGAYIFQKPFLRCLFLEGLIFRGAYVRREICDWASLIAGSKFTVFALCYFVFEGNFQVQPPGGLYLEGRFNGGFFALRVWGGGGLYLEGLIFGILRYHKLPS